jgi:hypothetical protein
VAKGGLGPGVDGVSSEAVAEKKPRLWPPFLRPDFFFAIIAFPNGGKVSRKRPIYCQGLLPTGFLIHFSP